MEVTLAALIGFYFQDFVNVCVSVLSGTLQAFFYIKRDFWKKKITVGSSHVATVKTCSYVM